MGQARSTMSRLGLARPVSTQLRWRVDTSAACARSSWLKRRRWRQWRSRSPKGAGVDRAGAWCMACMVGSAARRGHDLSGHGRAAAACRRCRPCSTPQEITPWPSSMLSRPPAACAACSGPMPPQAPAWRRCTWRRQRRWLNGWACRPGCCWPAAGCCCLSCCWPGRWPCGARQPAARWRCWWRAISCGCWPAQWCCGVRRG